MNHLKDLFSTILDYSTHREGLGPEDIKKIRMTNLACTVQSLNLFLLTNTAMIYGVYNYLPVLLFELLGLIGCLILQNRGRYTLAKVVLYLPILFAVSIACAGFEEKYQVIVYGFPLTFALFLLFGRKEKKVLYWLVFISLISLVSGNLAAGFIEPFFLLSDSPLMVYFVAVTSSQALTLSVLIVKGFFDESYRSEQRYIEAASTIFEQKERLQAVFDSVEEAILTIDENGYIQEGFSKFTQSILNRSISQIVGQNAFDLFVSASNHDRDEVAQCRSALEMSLGGDALQWEVNQSKILRELDYSFGGKRKFLVLNWQPIIRNGVITGLLLMCRDNTLHRLNDLLKADQQERNQILMGIVAAIMKSHRLAIEKFLAKALDRIKGLDPDNRQAAMFGLHTLKGVARSLGLQEIASRIHSIESALLSLTSLEIDSRFKSLAEHIELSSQMLRELIGADSHSFQMAPKNLYDIVSSNLINLYSLLEKNQLELASFQVEDCVLGWSSEALETISEAVLHAITNSIDHGFVFPKLRNELTAKKVQLQLRAWQEPLATVIEVTDNGNGIDERTLQALADKFQLNLAQYANPLDLLFESGVSNTTGVSLTSGRGVGASAILAAAVKLQGSAKYFRNPDRGLTVQLRIPRETSLYSSLTIGLRQGNAKEIV